MRELGGLIFLLSPSRLIIRLLGMGGGLAKSGPFRFSVR